MSSYRRSRAFVRGSFSHIPFLAAHERVSAGAAQAAHSKSGLRYPAIGLAVAAVAVAFAPLTASAAVAGHAPAKTVAATASVQHAAAKKTTDTKAAVAPATAAAHVAVAAPAKPAPAKTAMSRAARRRAEAAQSAVAASVSVSTKPYAGVSYADLEPTGTSGSQQDFTPDSDQWQNATSIVDAAKSLGLSPYAATIAVATAMQESSLQDLTTATNADSLGLFQQRPSMGWGSASELTDPTYAAKAFLRELPSDYQSMDLADAAQSVQRSFDGSLYAQWEDQAAHMVYQIANS